VPTSTEAFKEFYTSVVGRVCLGLVAIATTVANIPLAENLRFDLQKALVVAIAIGAWIGSELVSFKPSPHLHDIDLRNKLRTLITPHLYFLKNQNFEATFTRDELSIVWTGVSYDFQDRSLQTPWQQVRMKILDLYNHIGINAHHITGAPELFSFKNDGDRNGVSDKTEKNMKKANRLATEIYDELERLEKLCLKKLGAFSTLEPDRNRE
jgi:hypothetical protein